MVESLSENATEPEVDERVETHRSEETHDEPQPPTDHALGGDIHSASTRAAINALVEDADLESEQGAQGRVDDHAATGVHDEPQPPAGKGEPEGVAELNDSGVVRSGQVPSLAISETSTVTDEDDLTDLDAQEGDIGIVTSESQSYILTGDDPSTLDNWSEIESPPAPVDDVFGRTGSVEPEAGDYAADDIDNFTSTAADAAPVQSVNDEQGTVNLNAADVGAESDGAVSDHSDSTQDVHGVGSSDVESVSGAQSKADDAQSAAESYTDDEIDTHRQDETHDEPQPPEEHNHSGSGDGGGEISPETLVLPEASSGDDADNVGQLAVTSDGELLVATED